MKTTSQRIAEMKVTVRELRRELETLEGLPIRARTLLSEIDMKAAEALGSAEGDEQKIQRFGRATTWPAPPGEAA